MNNSSDKLKSLLKKAFTPPATSSSIQPAPQSEPQNTTAPAATPAQNDSSSKPSSDNAQGSETEILNMIDRLSEAYDSMNNRIDSLENQITTSNAKVTELYGNLNMLLHIIEKGDASGAIR